MPGPSGIPSLRDCEPQRICIVKPSALGDVVQSLPVLAGLRARWPAASISWVIREDLSDLVDGHPQIDKWLPYERRGGVRAFVRLLRRLRSGRFDLAIDLQGLARSAVMIVATGAPVRVGLETSRDASFLAHNVVLPNTGRDVPAHARYRRVAEALGVAGAQPSPLLPQSESTCQEAVAMLAGLPRPLLAVHPGAMWDSKRWPVGRFAAVLVRAVREWDVSVVVVGGPGEVAASRRLTDSVQAAVPGAIVRDLTGRTSVGQLAVVLEQADLLLTNDSGPMHLAAAAGTPVVGLFTSTSPVLSGPPLLEAGNGPQHQLVATPVACAGCYRRRCPLTRPQKYGCYHDLSVDMVWQALQACVNQNDLCRVTGGWGRPASGGWGRPTGAPSGERLSDCGLPAADHSHPAAPSATRTPAV